MDTFLLLLIVTIESMLSTTIDNSYAKFDSGPVVYAFLACSSSAIFYAMPLAHLWLMRHPGLFTDNGVEQL